MKDQIKILQERIKEMEKVVEVLIIAIPKEESSYKFYLELANSIEHEGSRRMFIKVANQLHFQHTFVSKLLISNFNEHPSTTLMFY